MFIQWTANSESTTLHIYFIKNAGTLRDLSLVTANYSAILVFFQYVPQAKPQLTTIA